MHAIRAAHQAASASGAIRKQCDLEIMRLNGLWTHGEDLARIFDWWVGACGRKIACGMVPMMLASQAMTWTRIRAVKSTGPTGRPPMTISETACLHALTLLLFVSHCLRRVAQVDEDDGILSVSFHTKK